MAASGRKGIEKVFRGVLKYRQSLKETMAGQLDQATRSPNPGAVFFSCIDARLQTSKFTHTDPGDMYVVRNASNFVPHAGTADGNPESAALELGVVMNNLRHVVVCGHSDCKAINLLLGMKDDFEEDGVTLKPTVQNSPMIDWLRRNGRKSLIAFNRLQSESFEKPLRLKDESAGLDVTAFIGGQPSLSEADKLSQVNTLVQWENIASYPFMAERMKSGCVHLHGFWFDIGNAEVMCFSKKAQHFVPITEHNVEEFMDDVQDKLRSSG